MVDKTCAVLVKIDRETGSSKLFCKWSYVLPKQQTKTKDNLILWVDVVCPVSRGTVSPSSVGGAKCPEHTPRQAHRTKIHVAARILNIQMHGASRVKGPTVGPRKVLLALTYITPARGASICLTSGRPWRTVYSQVHYCLGSLSLYSNLVLRRGLVLVVDLLERLGVSLVESCCTICTVPLLLTTVCLPADSSFSSCLESTHQCIISDFTTWVLDHKLTKAKEIKNQQHNR
jgi:hypothetical protein